MRAQSAVMASTLVTARMAMSRLVGARVAHHADGVRRGDDREILPDVAREAGFGDLFAQDVVCVAQRLQLFLRHRAHECGWRGRGRGRAGARRRSRGRPSSVPTLRTSSLNRSRSGSTISLKSTTEGSPPTLWWLLMTADEPCRSRRRRDRWCPARGSRRRRSFWPPPRTP